MAVSTAVMPQTDAAGAATSASPPRRTHFIECLFNVERISPCRVKVHYLECLYNAKYRPDHVQQIIDQSKEILPRIYAAKKLVEQEVAELQAKMKEINKMIVKRGGDPTRDLSDIIPAWPRPSASREPASPEPVSAAATAASTEAAYRQAYSTAYSQYQDPMMAYSGYSYYGMQPDAYGGYDYQTMQQWQQQQQQPQPQAAAVQQHPQTHGAVQTSISLDQHEGDPQPKLYVVFPDKSITDSQLRVYVQHLEGLQESHVVLDKETGMPKGFGFLNFVSIEATMKARDYLRSGRCPVVKEARFPKTSTVQPTPRAVPAQQWDGFGNAAKKPKLGEY